ncbi:exodeoxyribonuclease VII small subunit [Sphingobacteriaceae bacterium WQ 2009]|uniref:Exodeoxyribonuclease VII small subunit n=1 Tax=Rhinopithecimicrobium faecis TaxID=2820698 RepID=A0A8T4H5Y4_9SPHI|nr:exodeoxyribonuclease VII small subunit [Sphingobacteriaceae bacterium WQ 2009]
MEKYTYSEAFMELQQIVSQIESADIDIDTLSEKIKRASELIEVCKAKLTATEQEVTSLLAKLTPPNTPE